MMVYYEATKESNELFKEFYCNWVWATERPLKTKYDKFNFESFELIRKQYAKKGEMKYLPKLDAYAFLAAVNKFDGVFVIRAFFPNKMISYYFGNKDELTTLRLYHELEGRSV